MDQSQNNSIGTFSIKVVSSLTKREYQGAPVQRGSGAGRAMNRLKDGNSSTSSNNVASTTSAVLANFDLGNKKLARIDANLDLLLETAYDLADPEAIRAQDQFFSAVEAGKRALVQKHPDGKVPLSEISALSDRLKDKSVTVYKHQIITTRTQADYFPGAEKVGNGYTLTVKSKAFYTLQPLTEEEIKSLQDAIASVEPVTKVSLANWDRRFNTVYATYSEDKETGRVTFHIPDGSETARILGRSGVKRRRRMPT